MKQRSSNFELLRIVSMFMIVLSHCVYYGIIYDRKQDISLAWTQENNSFKFVTSFSILGAIGVGLFFMITGYFSENKKKISILRVSTITFFYAIFSFIISLISAWGGVQPFGSTVDWINKTMQLLIIPLTGSVWWFVTAYIILALVSPLYNKFLYKLNRNGFKVILIILLIFGYTFGNFGSNFHDLEKALLFYTLGTYFKLYRTDNERSILKYLVFGIVGILLNGLLQYEILINMVSTAQISVVYRKIFSILVHLAAEPLSVYGIFGVFDSLTMQCRFINKIAPHMFGVYLFHEAPIIRVLLWSYFLSPTIWYGKTVSILESNNLFIYFSIIIVITLAVFCIGIGIDIIRKKLFENNMSNMVEKILEKFKNKCLKV